VSKKYTVQPDVPCGAKTRAGTPCTNIPVDGKRRCRLHRGGAPVGNKNRLTHGFYTAEAVAERAWMKGLLKELKGL